MTKNNLYVDIHVLQTVPSSNINRDDTGAPKTAIYGGATRSRVSSQSWKKAIREGFKKDSKEHDWLNGFRTKRTATLLAKELMKQDSSLSFDDARKKAKEVLSNMGLKFDKAKKGDKNNDKDFETKVLLFFSAGQLKKLAEYILNNDEINKIDELDKKEATKVLKEAKNELDRNQSLDLALFGRMVADDPELNVEASAQVAHAISTHEVVPEFDFFTAVDDAKTSEESGSAMLGTLEYNSSTLYRYANVNMNELIHNLGEELAQIGLKEFIKNFALTMPTGHQNSYANKTLPQYILVTIREDTPVNLISAFERPIQSNNGYAKKSIEQLEAEFDSTSSWIGEPLASFVHANKEFATTVGERKTNIDELLNDVSTVVAKRVENEDTDD